MSSLLVQSCSATKNQVSQPTPAIDVYDGYFFRIIKKAMREEKFRSDIDLCILSAEHGILNTDDMITHYDRRMTADRADELRESVSNEIRSRVKTSDYETIIFNVGNVYKQAIGDISEKNNICVKSIEGDGIGNKGRQLKQLIRSEIALEEPL